MSIDEKTLDGKLVYDVYTPEEVPQGKKLPTVVGFPGLCVAHDEGKIDYILRGMAGKGFLGFGFTPPDLEKYDAVTRVRFTLAGNTKDMRRALEKVHKDPRVDRSRVYGIFISASCGVMPYAQSHLDAKLVLQAVVLLAPFPGGNYMPPETRDYVTSQIKDNGSSYLNLSSPWDKDNGHERQLDISTIEDLMLMDPIGDIGYSGPGRLSFEKNFRGPIKTVYGANDQWATEESVQRLHELFRGTPENCIRVPGDHHLSIEESSRHAMDFILDNP